MAEHPAAHYRRRRGALGKKVREKTTVRAGHEMCRICDRTRPHAAWHRNTTASDGLSTRRKTCRGEQGRAGHLKRQYGMTVEERQPLVASRFGIRPNCLKPEPEHVDHAHGTGRVRGVPCFNCNSAIGKLRDDPDTKRRAIAYVEGNVWKPTLVAPGVYLLPS